MSALSDTKGFAARMGRWSANHKKTAIFGWFAFVAVAFLIGNVVGTNQLDQQHAGVGESGHVSAVLADNFKQPQGGEVFMQSSTSTVDDPAFRAAITDVRSSLDALPETKRVRSPFDRQGGRVSADRHTALVAIELGTTDLAEAKTLDVPVSKAIVAAAARHP